MNPATDYDEAYAPWGYLIFELEKEVERLQRQIDAAFKALPHDPHAARLALTEARWGK